MPTTTTHKIYYPSGTATPNIPVQMQTSAESVEASLDKITKAPLIICEKTGSSTTSSTANTYTDVSWQTEIHKQGITHAASSSSFTVTESGIYQITARIGFQTNGDTGKCIANINGIDKETTRTDETGTAAAWPKPSFTSYLKLTAGDVVKIRCASTAASTPLNVPECSFQMAKVVVY